MNNRLNIFFALTLLAASSSIHGAELQPCKKLKKVDQELFYAVIDGDSDRVCKSIAQGANINAQVELGATALHAAVDYESATCEDYDVGNRRNDMTNFNKKLSHELNLVTIIPTLLKQPNIDFSIKDRYDRTAIDIARERKDAWLKKLTICMLNPLNDCPFPRDQIGQCDKKKCPFGCSSNLASFDVDRANRKAYLLQTLEATHAQNVASAKLTGQYKIKI